MIEQINQLEESQENGYEGEKLERNDRSKNELRFEPCGRECKFRGGVAIDIKRIH